jgi:hypothetical protein
LAHTNTFLRPNLPSVPLQSLDEIWHEAYAEAKTHGSVHPAVKQLRDELPEEAFRGWIDRADDPDGKRYTMLHQCRWHRDAAAATAVQVLQDLGADTSLLNHRGETAAGTAARRLVDVAHERAAELQVCAHALCYVVEGAGSKRPFHKLVPTDPEALRAALSPVHDALREAHTLDPDGTLRLLGQDANAYDAEGGQLPAVNEEGGELLWQSKLGNLHVSVVPTPSAALPGGGAEIVPSPSFCPVDQSIGFYGGSLDHQGHRNTRSALLCYATGAEARLRVWITLHLNPDPLGGVGLTPHDEW